MVCIMYLLTCLLYVTTCVKRCNMHIICTSLMSHWVTDLGTDKQNVAYSGLKLENPHTSAAHHRLNECKWARVRGPAGLGSPPTLNCSAQYRWSMRCVTITYYD